MKLIASLLLSLFMLAPLEAQEPVYNDRPLSEWASMLKNDPLPRKRRAAVVALGEIAQSNSSAISTTIPLIGTALKNDASSVVREQAALTLGLQKTEDTLIALDDLAIAMRQEKDAKVLTAVATALSRFGKLAKLALAPLMDALSQNDAGLQTAVADALGRIGADATTATEKLLPFVKSEHAPVRRAAVFALGRIEPEDKIAVSSVIVAYLRSEKEPRAQLEAIVTLGLLSESGGEVVPALLAVLSASDKVNRLAILETLRLLRTTDATVVTALVNLFAQEQDKLLRCQIVRSLGVCLNQDEAKLVEILTKPISADPDFEVRVAIVEELGSLKVASKVAIPLVRQAQKDPQIQVREAAGLALKNLLKLDNPKKP